MLLSEGVAGWRLVVVGRRLFDSVIVSGSVAVLGSRLLRLLCRVCRSLLAVVSD